MPSLRLTAILSERRTYTYELKLKSFAAINNTFLPAEREGISQIHMSKKRSNHLLKA